MKDAKEERTDKTAESNEEAQILEGLISLSNEEITAKTRILESNIRPMNSELRRYDQDISNKKLFFRIKKFLNFPSPKKRISPRENQREQREN